MDQIVPLSPLREISSVQGTVSWNDDRRKIIINKALRLLYQELNKRTARIGYKMEFCMNKDKLHEQFHKHLENGRMPIFLFFYLDKGKCIAG